MQARLLLGIVIVFVIMPNWALAQTVPISPIAASPQPPGAQFTVEVKVGDAAAPVSNLFGLSFVLNYTNTSFVDVVGTPVAGNFLGNDIIFFPNVDDLNGKVSVGMTRKGGGGVNGNGVVMQVVFSSLPTTPNGTPVQFTINEITATDDNGTLITLTPTSLTVTIGVVIQCPTVSGINPASGVVGTNVTITGTNFTEVTAVKFANNVSANFSVTSATQISTTVPTGAVTGPITLGKAGCGEVQTGVFTVLASRDVRVVDTTAFLGNMAMAAIELQSQGDENALGFSLSFDPAILSNPQAQLGRDANTANLVTNVSQANLGRFGVAVALPAGQRFAAGKREIVVVSFLVSGTTNATSASIDFGDQPIAREAIDTNARSLLVNWIPGTITFVDTFEGDVAPRSNGNGAVTLDDWAQLGRFAARLDTPRTNPNEFQRADCAPTTCGDGRLGISDWVQAGRYAAGLDAVVTACGPETPISLLAAKAKSAATREVRAVSASFNRGQIGSLAVELVAESEENALGFSLNFDASLLVFQDASLGSGAISAQLIVNSNQAASGLLGIALALPAGQTFVAGTQPLLVVTFLVNRNTSASTTQIALGSQLVPTEISSVKAENLAAIWTPATITISDPTAVNESKEAKIPTAFALEQNYPNPFLSGAQSRTAGNPSTVISFSLPRQSRVTLKVFNVVGEEVGTLVDQELSAGRYKAHWDAGRMNGGVYFYRLQAGSFVQTRKLILIR